MKKLSIFIFLFIFLLSANSVFSLSLSADIQKKIFMRTIEKKIISREEWWAHEEYRFLDSVYWKAILKKNAEESASMTEYEKKKKEEKLAKRRTIFNYLNKYFSTAMGMSEIIFEENGRPLARPIKKTNYVKSIILHHTGNDYKDSLSWMHSIYRFHALWRQWGDIGYNFVIGYDGEIFEWRAGGSYVEAAHILRNNSATVGISIMGDYDHKPISSKQYTSLKALVEYLTYKYGINLYDTFPLHTECYGESCKNGVTSREAYTFAGHRDGGHTNCPWDELYSQLQKIRSELQAKTISHKSIKNPWNKKEILSDE